MVRTCIVLGCSGSKIDKNISLFSVPKDPELFDAWKSNLKEVKKPLSASSYVCEKHFDPNDVVSQYVLKLPTEVWSYTYSKKRLKPKSIPLSSGIHNTLNNDNLSNNVDKLLNKNDDDNISIETISIDGSLDTNDNDNISFETVSGDELFDPNDDDDISIRFINVDDFQSEHVSTQTVSNMVDMSTQTEHHEERDNEQDDNCEELFTFDTLLKNLNNLKYRGNSYWTTIIAPNKKTVFFFIISTDNILRRVEIYDDLTSRVIIQFLEIHKNYLHHNFKNKDEVVDYLIKVYNWKLCATIKDPKKFISETVCEGVASLHHHNMGRPTLRCASCNKKIKTQKKPNDLPKNSPVKNVIKNKILQQKVRRFKKRIDSLEAHVSELRQKCASVEEQTLENAIHNVKDVQKTLIKECLQTAKKGDANKKGIRYDMKWIHQCLLLRMKGPSVYDSLRNDETLPLPSRQTLKKYISSFDNSLLCKE